MLPYSIWKTYFFLLLSFKVCVMYQSASALTHQELLFSTQACFSSQLFAAAVRENIP